MNNRKYLIINGPNLNLLGIREQGIYGNESFEDFMENMITPFCREKGYIIETFQSNHEGAIIDKLHLTLNKENKFDGIVLNAGAYTHTSLAIADAIASISTPVVEVHISHILAREPIRHTSLIAPYCIGLISGFGLDSYLLAMIALEGYLSKKNK